MTLLEVGSSNRKKSTPWFFSSKWRDGSKRCHPWGPQVAVGSIFPFTHRVFEVFLTHRQVVNSSHSSRCSLLWCSLVPLSASADV